MTVLRNIAFYLAFYGGSVVLVLIALTVIALAPAQLAAIARQWSRWHQWCVRRLLRIRIVETGQRPRGLVLFAIKHEAFFEAIALPALFDNPVVIAKQELFDIPGWGRVARAFGAIPVARGDGAKALRSMVRSAKALAKGSRPVVIFPEGTRVPHGERPDLQAGFAAMYKVLGLPVVPVAVNSGPLYQRKWKRSGTLEIRFGDAIPAGLPREEIEARVRTEINALNGPGLDQDKDRDQGRAGG